MSAPDPYAMLGVSRSASAEEIRLAYRRRAAELHPDRHPAGRRAWASEQMIQLNMARDLLLNPRRRAEHDHSQRLEQHKKGWRTRQAAPARPAPAAPAEMRPVRLNRPMLLIGLTFGLGLCLYILSYAYILTTLPQARTTDDLGYWFNVLMQVVWGLTRTLVAPTLFVAVVIYLLVQLRRRLRR